MFGTEWSYEDALTSKIYEGFLEAGPQAAFQLYVQMKTGSASPKVPTRRRLNNKKTDPHDSLPIDQRVVGEESPDRTMNVT